MRNLLSCLLLSGKKNKIERNTILLAVLCGHETWRITFICEDILRVFEKSVVRKIMGTKREELREGWWKFYNEELHNLQPSQI